MDTMDPQGNSSLGAIPTTTVWRPFYYKDAIADFLRKTPAQILGELTAQSPFAVDTTQRDAWLAEVSILQTALADITGTVYLEFSIPRMGARIDTVLIIGAAVLVIEFKVGADSFDAYALDQVWDYALDLKNFHEPSHRVLIAPILISTAAPNPKPEMGFSVHNDKVLKPIRATSQSLPAVITRVLGISDGPEIDSHAWDSGRYKPTPTIIEAVRALYAGHKVEDIWRNAAEAQNLGDTSRAISNVIQESRTTGQKSICLVTGVPGAGKTLVGLSMANKHIDLEHELFSVFLSGNDPLVAVLREALARDKVEQARLLGLHVRKADALREVKALIQNIRHFRDESRREGQGTPAEHVALFDEAQRAWTRDQLARFMKRRRNILNFDQSEPETLISYMDRHQDWAVIVCLIGGGQEIHSGEAGMTEWISALRERFGHWHVFVSQELRDSEYGAGAALDSIRNRPNVTYLDELHLAVSMRSFRAESVSLLVRQVLDLELSQAKTTLAGLDERYPIVVTRDVATAKQWLRGQARGNERYGIVVSSQAERLRPHAIFVRSPVDPVHWFLNGKDDVRSSYHLEDVVTEFAVQGLELDWACVTWDADFRFRDGAWDQWEFKGSRWQRIVQAERRTYHKNAYRVLLTRARQGMVIVVPPGDDEDPTRKREFYDPTYEYLRGIGFKTI
jgi:hypothetical protein